MCGPQSIYRTDRLAVFHQYRGLLFSIAYRMLGKVAGAEDVVQETFMEIAQTLGRASLIAGRS